jgi:hypothetical protein
MTATGSSVDAPDSALTALWQFTAPLRGALAAGAIAGFLIAGLGSRAAMRIVALADSSTDGALTQDQFIVGEMNFGDTAGLVILGTIVGLVSGLIYLGIRRWMPVPRWLRGLAFGYGALVTGGLLLINPDSVDFRIFEPVILPIALFAALFVLGGGVLAFLGDRFHREPEYVSATLAPRLVAGLLVLVTLIGTVVMAANVVELIDKEGTCVSANTDFECVPAREVG